MRTRIVNGTVVTAEGQTPADVLVDGERIAAVGRLTPATGDRVIDATGCYVLPGGVDPHTHLDLPVGGGIVSSDDFETGTVAAAFGGTTTIIDFPTPERGGSLLAARDAWLRRLEGRAVVDVGFHMIVASWDAASARELRQLVEDGITSFKLFMAYPDRLMLDDGAIFEVMQRSRDIGALVMLHAENGGVIETLVRQAIAGGHTAPRYHAVTRPPAVEVEAVHRAIVLAALSGAPLYVVHVSTAGAVDEIAAARAKGRPVMGETCPQYLCLDERAYESEGARATHFVMSPPLRPRAMQARLWKGLADGDLQTVGTDHCPFLERDKLRGLHDFSRIPNGAPGIEHRLVLLHDAGVTAGRLAMSRVVDLYATTPAKVFGLYPRKGAIAAGSDADLVIFDPAASQTISTAAHHMRVDYDPYEGREVKGVVRAVLSRGEVIVEGARFLGRAGRGRYLPRPPARPI